MRILALALFDVHIHCFINSNLSYFTVFNNFSRLYLFLIITTGSSACLELPQQMTPIHVHQIITFVEIRLIIMFILVILNNLSKSHKDFCVTNRVLSQIYKTRNLHLSGRLHNYFCADVIKQELVSEK